MDFEKLKLPFASSNIIIWVVVISVILGFGNSSQALGFGLFGTQGNNDLDGKGYNGGGNYGQGFTNMILGPKFAQINNGFLKGNGLFIIAIVVIIFLCKDKKKVEEYGEEFEEDDNEEEPVNYDEEDFEE